MYWNFVAIDGAIMNQLACKLTCVTVANMNASLDRDLLGRDGV
jgi:hypothetical protein